LVVAFSSLTVSVMKPLCSPDRPLGRGVHRTLTKFPPGMKPLDKARGDMALPPGAKLVEPPPGDTLDNPKVQPYTLTYADGAISVAEDPYAKYGGKVNPDTLPADFFSKDGNEIIVIYANGIREAMMNKNGALRAIHLETGEWAEESTSPRLKSYLVTLLYPILGFILPWGVMRALTWVGSGFFEPNRL